MLSGFFKNAQDEEVQCHNYFYVKTKIWFDQFTLECIPPPRQSCLFWAMKDLFLHFKILEF